MLPAHDRPLLRVGGRSCVELSGYRFAYRDTIITAIGEEAVGPTEVKRFLGAELADTVDVTGPLVLVEAQLPTLTFTEDGQTLHYMGRDGRQSRRVAEERTNHRHADPRAASRLRRRVVTEANAEEASTSTGFAAAALERLRLVGSRRKVPVIHQLSQLDCGVASLAMVLGTTVATHASRSCATSSASIATAPTPMPSSRPRATTASARAA